MTRTGASQVIAAAVGQAAESLGRASSAADPEQLAFLAPPTRFEGARAQEMTAKLERYHSGRGGGRPKGAQNKATVHLRKWLLARGEDPLESMHRWSQHSPETLALEIGCTTAEAYDRLMSLKQVVASFLHPRLSPVNDDGQAVPMFQMTVMANAAAGIVGFDREPWLGDPEVAATIKRHEQNQALSEHGSVRPTTDGSHAQGQEVENNDELPL